MALITITASTIDEAYPYQKLIKESGAKSIIVTAENFTSQYQSLNEITGLLLTGGSDIHPKYYGQEIDPQANIQTNEERDEMEFALLRTALEKNIPILAICRGMQLLNVAFGGSLIQHIDGHGFGTEIADPGPGPFSHSVYVSPGSKLAAIIGLGAVYRTNSMHHQGFRDAQKAVALLASAYHVEDGIIEGLESPSHDWVIGVQCHPEKVNEVPSNYFRLFQGFVERSENLRA